MKAFAVRHTHACMCVCVRTHAHTHTHTLVMVTVLCCRVARNLPFGHTLDYRVSKQASQTFHASSFDHTDWSCCLC